MMCDHFCSESFTVFSVNGLVKGAIARQREKSLAGGLGIGGGRRRDASCVLSTAGVSQPCGLSKALGPRGCQATAPL
jgi:hypothetical protein